MPTKIVILIIMAALVAAGTGCAWFGYPLRTDGYYDSMGPKSRGGATSSPFNGDNNTGFNTGYDAPI